MFEVNACICTQLESRLQSTLSSFRFQRTPLLPPLKSLLPPISSSELRQTGCRSPHKGPFAGKMSESSATIPEQFKCPISLDVMREPVTLCTGITYDRDSITQWFQQGNVTCPTTMQTLQTLNLTPNHTLKRLIQGWCAIHNPSFSSASSADEKAIETALSDLRNSPRCLSHLDILASLANKNEHNRSLIASSEAPSLLLQIICLADRENRGSLQDFLCVEKALAILAWLPMPCTCETETATFQVKETMNVISSVFCRKTSMPSIGTHAAQVICAILRANDNLKSSFSGDPDLFNSVASTMRLGTPVALKAALDLLLIVSPVRRNRIRVVEAGIVGLLIETLADAAKRNVAEKSLAVIEIISQCAEGRASVCGHSLGIHVLVKKIARVSEAATESAVSALWNIFRNCMTACVAREMDEAGAYSKLVVLLQIGCGPATKKKAKDMLRYYKGSVCDAHPCSLITSDHRNPANQKRCGRDLRPAKIHGLPNFP